MPKHVPCLSAHGAYRYMLQDALRICRCNECGHQWEIHLGSGATYNENETDYIANAKNGLEFMNEQLTRAARFAATRGV